MNPVDQFPDDDNGLVLRQMAQHGDDLSKSRDIDFSVVFPGEDRARKFGVHFAKAGYQVGVEEAGTVSELPWDVVVVKHMIPTHEGITEFEKELEAAARPLGGRIDGWGCVEQPKSIN